MTAIRNRIKGHRLVRAGDLLPHELNARTHPETQTRALRALYDEIGFARSLLAYELDDGRLKLIDGHLRQNLDPDMEVNVEVLDVTEDEARALLLSIDPLTGLAGYDRQVLDELRSITHTDSAGIQELWQTIAWEDEAVQKNLSETEQESTSEPLGGQYLVLVECDNEPDQVALLQRLLSEGLRCRALLG